MEQLRSVTLSSIDPGHGAYVYIDMVFTSSIDSLILDTIQSELKKRGYELFDIKFPEQTHYTPPASISKVVLSLQGLTCQSCITTVSTGLRLNGVKKSIVTLDKAQVVFDKQIISPKEIQNRIEELGFIAKITESESSSIIEEATLPSVTQNALNQDVLINLNDNLHKSTFNVQGMSCSSCVNSIENIMKSQYGVEPDNVVVTLLPPRVVVVFDPTKISNDGLLQVIQDLGFEASILKTGPLQEESVSEIEIKISIKGMTCSSCVNSIETYLKDLKGINFVNVNLITEVAVIKFFPGLIGTRDVLEAIETIGYEAYLVKDDIQAIGNSDLEQDAYFKDMLIALVFTIPAFFLMISMMFLQGTFIEHFLMTEIKPGLSLDDLLGFLLSTPVQFYLGKRFYKGAWKSLYYLKTANVIFCFMLDGHINCPGNQCFVLLFYFCSLHKH
jgi:Cu+-exporting ATPase